MPGDEVRGTMSVLFYHRTRSCSEWNRELLEILRSSLVPRHSCHFAITRCHCVFGVKGITKCLCCQNNKITGLGRGDQYPLKYRNLRRAIIANVLWGLVYKCTDCLSTSVLNVQKGEHFSCIVSVVTPLLWGETCTALSPFCNGENWGIGGLSCLSHTHCMLRYEFVSKSGISCTSGIVSVSVSVLFSRLLLASHHSLYIFVYSSICML